MNEEILQIEEITFVIDIDRSKYMDAVYTSIIQNKLPKDWQAQWIHVEASNNVINIHPVNSPPRVMQRGDDGHWNITQFNFNPRNSGTAKLRARMECNERYRKVKS